MPDATKTQEPARPNSPLGDRMKRYEAVTQTHLPRRTYTIVRLDGRCFHTYTRGLGRPYDLGLMADMDQAAFGLLTETAGGQFAYVQSDEVSVLLTDFATTGTEPWFDGNVQKLCSVSASIMTACFNDRRLERPRPSVPATFDARVFTIPDRTEVINYFLWRQRDCVRNSIMSTAQAHFGHKWLHGLNTDQIQDLLWKEAGINWNDQPDGFKRGRVIQRVSTDDTWAATGSSSAAPHISWDLTQPETAAFHGMVPEFP